METKLEKEVRFWKIYAAMTTLFCAMFFLSAFAAHSKRDGPRPPGMIFSTIWAMK
ncbi:MAG: hypothetical protein JF614_26245 [Acidobacteria bacterium]|nr:hypothetical protein [Acidobacteriota bacterium]